MSGNHSLVKYDNPVLISVQSKKKKEEAKNTLTPTEDILNSILPPREWTENGDLWVQYVSSAPSTKKDVLHLQKTLDTKLQQKQARETGLCPIREELYSQAFDELIRQVTIMCAERGLLLLRVREELRMEISTYQTLYESSIAYGMRCALRQKQSNKEQAALIRKLQRECAVLETKVQEKIEKSENHQLKAKDDYMIMSDKHSEDVMLIKKYNAKLRKTLSEKLSIDTANAKQNETNKESDKTNEEAEEKKKEESEKKVE
mmetsp:Transcript_16043/g.28807  ORF Transcript_16043/g.28807 Transcript_16043/m.28807 type:complete len:260 (+) Transcript_16043:95-874(+)|eukprot:CAMPEP_0197527258 /NCGR_PEP_ID=MMETSP1318-20131121/20880_1 /TAXON_ID=552666 /ORGANISM="Partenskyella glossopodia, Strain RCC365" /LENGTH=259 /DNA_ID=CAMNT_0043081805 /DNA_START=75 /DNA_END=854 /DNA_ORIENTATION=-